MLFEIINYSIRSSACLLLLYAGYTLVLSRETCFRFNRMYLLSSLLLAFTLPLLSIPFYYNAQLPISPDVLILPTVIIREEMIGNIPFDWQYWVGFLYFGVAAVLLLRFVMRLINVIKHVITRPHIIKGNYKLIETAGVPPTSSFFNYVFWDRTQVLNTQAASQILKHEVAHVTERHTLDLILLEMLCIVGWFNPLIWQIKKRVVENHEYIADHIASENTKGYSTVLANHVLQTQGITLSHPFKSHEVFKRLRMLDNAGKKTVLSKYLIIGVTLCLTVFTMACSVEEIIDTNSIKESELSIPESEVFRIVEETATPVGGMETFYTYIANNMEYPNQAKAKGIEGKVFVEFIVNKNGEITSPKILKSAHPMLDQTALSVISDAPDWNPGKQRGKAVHQKVVVPIVFKLTD